MGQVDTMVQEFLMVTQVLIGLSDWFKAYIAYVVVAAEEKTEH